MAAKDKQEYFSKQECLSFGDFNIADRYKVFQIPKRNSKRHSYRTIQAPSQRLKQFLKYANTILYKTNLVDNNCSFGFIKGKNVVMNACQHINKKYVCNLDLKDFFPSILYKKALTSAIKHIKNVDTSILELCIKASCVYTSNSIHLAQGSPLSPYLANIVCKELDEKLYNLCINRGFSYSRYADDITFSTDDHTIESINSFLDEAKGIIEREDFFINNKKTRIQSKYYNQSVTGITVNEHPNVKKTFIKDIRNILYIWKKYGYIEATKRFQIKYKIGKHIPLTASITLPRMENVIKGRIEYLKAVKGNENLQFKKIYASFQSLKERDYDFITTVPANKYTFMSVGECLLNKKYLHIDQENNTVLLWGKYDKILIPPKYLPLINIIKSQKYTINQLNSLFCVKSINKKEYKWALWLDAKSVRNAIKLGMNAYNKGLFNDAANYLRIATELGNYNFLKQYILACELSSQPQPLHTSNIEYLEPYEFNILLKKYFSLYATYGFNLSTIAGKNSNTTKNSFKEPLVCLDDIYSLNHSLLWKNATGIGTYLGQEDYRCLDIDYLPKDIQYKETTIKTILHLLHLPLDYGWVVNSGSGDGCHILFKSHNIDGFNPEVIAFNPSHRFAKANPFKRIELCWSHCFIVLPPSLHKSGRFYTFRNGETPTYEPIYVEHKHINSALDYFCGATYYHKLNFKNKYNFDFAYRVKHQLDEYSDYDYTKSHYKLPIEWLKTCNSPECLNELALKYLIGEEVETNIEKAVNLLKKANNTLSAFNLASLIAIGLIKDEDNFEKLIQQCKNFISKEHIEQIRQFYQDSQNMP